MPICNPEGKVVCSETVPPAGEWFDKADLQTPRAALITVSTDVCQVVGNDVHIGCWASRPVLAIHNELIIKCPVWISDKVHMSSCRMRRKRLIRLQVLAKSINCDCPHRPDKLRIGQLILVMYPFN